MRITKKNQILQLNKEGYEIEDIIKKGFNKKYVKQVLKSNTNLNLDLSSTNKINMGNLKQILSTIENLQTKSDKINVIINISIKVDNNTINSKNKDFLLNPVTLFRDIGPDALREKLMHIQLNDLLKIAKKYTPDINKKIYKEKDSNSVIDYIIERASNLSKVGQAFRTVNTSQ